MAAPTTAQERSPVALINFFCLLVAMVIVLALPRHKEIWYDETVSVLCSKGISHDTPALFAKDTTNSTTIQALNTPANVFKATVVDNGNSFLYNIALHWVTGICGNSMEDYMLLSKLCALGTLLAFFALCRLFLRDSIFTGLAVMLLATDTGFIAMSHEIRAYSMGILFVTLAALYLFYYLQEAEKPRWLFLTALFSAAAILSHFLTVYMVLVFIGVLLLRKGLTLFSIKNFVAVAVPVALLLVYFYLSVSGIRTMNLQNHAIQEKFTANQYNVSEVIFRSMRIMAMNFKVGFPAFRDNRVLFFGSFLFVLALYAAGLNVADREQKRNLHLLFICGVCSSIFLVLLSLKSQHYASLYFRYYSFGLPFSALFVAYLLHVFFHARSVKAAVKGGLVAIIVLPVFALFFITEKNEHPAVHYNHVAIAHELATDKGVRLTVPAWRDALLIQSFLPHDYYLDYFRNPASSDFVYYTTSAGKRVVPVIREDRE